MIRIQAWRVAAIAATVMLLALGGEAHGQQMWRVALVVKRKTNASYNGVTVNASMDQADVDAISNAFKTHVPEIVSRLSGGQVRWQTSVIDVPQLPVSQVVRITDQSCYPAPAEGLKDLGIELGVGYDAVFVYWLNTDKKGKTLQSAQNFGVGPYGPTHGAGYATIAWKPPANWSKNSEDTETFVHEWLHMLEQYYEGAVSLPRPNFGDSSYLHSVGLHPGYARVPSATDMGFWKNWYQAWLQGTIRQANGMPAGLGPNAWRLGTIRDKRVVKVNLANGDQEYPNSQWRGTSWANTQGFMITQNNVTVPRGATPPSDLPVLTNNNSTLLVAEMKEDDCRASQVVSVKPNTNYIFSAWVKTKNVTVQPGGRFGANLSLFGQPEASRSITGNTDWTWVSLPFNSGNRNSVELSLRLGHHGSLAKGRAWFDTVRLVEVR